MNVFWNVSDFHISGKDAYSIENDVQKIQQEIMTNGPVEGAFTVYEDFVNYKSGMEKTALWGASWHVLFVKYNKSDQVDEMGITCSMHGEKRNAYI
jgi:predicted small secreted protein